jgi:hypothetical protein
MTRFTAFILKKVSSHMYNGASNDTLMAKKESTWLEVLALMYSTLQSFNTKLPSLL